MSNKNAHKQKYTLLFLAFLSLVLVVLNETPHVRAVRGFFERPVVAVQRFSAMRLRQFFDFFSVFQKKEQLLNEVASLREEVVRLSAAQAELSVCLEEREAAQKMLVSSPPLSNWHFVPAKAVGVGAKLRLNVGARAGVAVGQMVVSQNVLVGRVNEVTAFSCTVELVTDPAVMIPVATRTPGQSQVQCQGILSGYVNQKLIVREVLWSEQLTEGDLVYTNGEGGWLANIVIGRIHQVEQEGARNFQSAVVEPFFVPKQLDTVFVIKILENEG